MVVVVIVKGWTLPELAETANYRCTEAVLFREKERKREREEGFHFYHYKIVEEKVHNL